MCNKSRPLLGFEKRAALNVMGGLLRFAKALYSVTLW